MDKAIKTIVAAGGAAVSYAYGGWSAMLGALLALVVVDYVSGFAASALEGKLSSGVGARGIAKKIGIFALVAIGHIIDGQIGEAHMVRDAAIWFYAANELLSIIENMGRLGVPIPPVIQQAVAVLQGKAGVNKGAE